MTQFNQILMKLTINVYKKHLDKEWVFHWRSILSEKSIEKVRYFFLDSMETIQFSEFCIIKDPILYGLVARIRDLKLEDGLRVPNMSHSVPVKCR